MHLLSNRLILNSSADATQNMWGIEVKSSMVMVIINLEISKSGHTGRSRKLESLKRSSRGDIPKFWFHRKLITKTRSCRQERCIQMCLHRKLSTKTHSNRQKRWIQSFAFHLWVGSLDQQSTVSDGSNLVAKMISIVFSKRTVMPHHHHNLPALRKQRKNLFARVLSSWMQQGIAGIFLPSSLCAWSARAHDVFVKLLCLKTLLLQESDETTTLRFEAPEPFPNPKP